MFNPTSIMTGMFGAGMDIAASQHTADAIRKGTAQEVEGMNNGVNKQNSEESAVTGLYQPQIDTGNYALSRYKNLLTGLKQPTYQGPTSFKFDQNTSPAARTQMMLAQRGLDASSAATGGGGGAARGMAAEMANNANSAYDTALNQYKTEADVQGNNFNREQNANQLQLTNLSPLISAGSSATSGLAGAKQDFGKNISNLLAGIGTAKGSGTIAAGSAISSGLTQAGNAISSGANQAGNQFSAPSV